MAHVRADRVMETTTTTGTGNITVSGALSGFRALSSRLSIGDTFDYVIFAVDGSGASTGEWETGVGTYTGVGQFSRSVLQSSSSDALVNFSAGTKHVAMTLTASAMRNIERANWTLIGSSTISSTTNSLEFDLTGFQEVLLLADNIAASATSRRAVQVSVDGGSSWLTGSSDYSAISSSGALSTAALILLTNTDSASGRSGILQLQLDGLRLFSVGNVGGLDRRVTGTAGKINRLRVGCSNTAVFGLAADMTSGAAHVYGR